ncbi:MAG TPA: Hsp20/alpha crystallin family protein [Burkholderiales bacterium]
MANIIRQDPFAGGIASAGLRDPFEFVTPLFGRFMRMPETAGPRMDVRESGEAYVMEVEIPGVDKNAISVSVYNDTVTIEAEVREEKAADKETAWLLRERSFGRIARTVTLPEEMDETASSAKWENGVLYLTLPKKRTSAAKRLAIH